MVIKLQGLQAAADNQQTQAPMTWQALNADSESTGAPSIDYFRFAARWDAEDENGILHQLVDRFDRNGIVIKTQEKEPEVVKAEPKSNVVSQMAKRATKLGK